MIGYKTASSKGKRVLVTLDIPDDANTNINRNDVTDKQFAKYRCDKAHVISIEDEEGNTYNSASTSIFIFKKMIKYVVGKEVIELEYDKDINVVYGEGIHFFLDKKIAQLYGLNKVDNGEYKEWHHNGNLKILSYYKERKLEGEFKQWYYDGQLCTHCYYKDGELDGEYKTFHFNRKAFKYYNYKKGVLDGIYKLWDVEGKLVTDGMYVNGEKIEIKN